MLTSSVFPSFRCSRRWHSSSCPPARLPRPRSPSSPRAPSLPGAMGAPGHHEPGSGVPGSLEETVERRPVYRAATTGPLMKGDRK